MTWRLNGGFRAACFAPRRLQLHSVDQLSTFVALVTACVIVGAERTSAFDKAVRQEPKDKKKAEKEKDEEENGRWQHKKKRREFLLFTFATEQLLHIILSYTIAVVQTLKDVAHDAGKSEECTLDLEKSLCTLVINTRSTSKYWQTNQCLVKRLKKYAYSVESDL